MFETLLASHPRTRRPRWGVGFAIVLHAGVLGMLLRPSAKAATPVVMIPVESFPIEVTPVRPVRLRPLTDPGPGQTIVLTLPIPEPIVGVPPDAPSMPGAPGTPVTWRDSSTVPAGDPWPVPLVQEAPLLLTAPIPAYPTRLREAGIQGQVIIEAVVDTLGRVEPGSIRVVSSDHADFEAPATASIRASLFRPARVFGRGVRVLVRVPVTFRLR